MGKSLVKGCVLGGIILFVWGFFSWAVLPWHNMTFNTFKDPVEVGKVIAKNAMEDGVYIMPCDHCNKEDRPLSASEKESVHKGPFVFATVRLSGISSPHMVKEIVRSLFIQALAALFATWILVHTKGLKYWKKVRLVAVLGLFAGILAYLPMWNWMAASSGYTVVGIADYLVGWFFAGLAIAKVA